MIAAPMDERTGRSSHKFTAIANAIAPKAMGVNVFAGRTHPTFHTPGAAMVFEAGVAMLLVLTGTYQELYSLDIFATWIFLGLAAAALIRLRIINSALHRPFRTWDIRAIRKSPAHQKKPPVVFTCALRPKRRLSNSRVVNYRGIDR